MSAQDAIPSLLERVAVLQASARASLSDVKDVVERRAGAYDDPKAIYQLPPWPDLDVRVIPNHLARSSLFAVVGRKKGPRLRYDKVVISSRSDVSIQYSGPQLDMADSDVFMQALQLAKNIPLGQPVYFKRRDFLAALNKTDAGSWYEWLEGSIDRLLEATLYIKTKRYTVGEPDLEEPDVGAGAGDRVMVGKRHRAGRRRGGLHLIAGFEYDDDHESYYLLFDQRILTLFQNQEFSLVDWQARRLIERRVDLAKWLQSYVSSHEPGVVHRIGIKLLREWCGYTSPLNKFRVAVGDALQELERVGSITSAKIRADGMASWVRVNPGR